MLVQQRVQRFDMLGKKSPPCENFGSLRHASKPPPTAPRIWRCGMLQHAAAVGAWFPPLWSTWAPCRGIPPLPLPPPLLSNPIQCAPSLAFSILFLWAFKVPGQLAFIGAPPKLKIPLPLYLAICLLRSQMGHLHVLRLPLGS